MCQCHQKTLYDTDEVLSPSNTLRLIFFLYTCYDSSVVQSLLLPSICSLVVDLHQLYARSTLCIM